MQPEQVAIFMFLSVVLVVQIVAGIGFVRLRRTIVAPPSLPPAAQPDPRVPLDLNNAMETVLVKAMESQGAMFERMQKLNVENAQLAMDMLMRGNARRAGRARAKSGLRQGGRFVRNCRLCQNSMIPDPTVAEIVAHSAHHVGGRPRVTQEADGAVAFHVKESELDGPNADRVEDTCETCGGNHLPGQQHLPFPQQ